MEIYIYISTIAILVLILALLTKSGSVQVSGYDYNGNPKEPRFTIDKIEDTFEYDEEHNKLVRYTASGGFYTKTNGKGFRMLYITFYGEVGLYNIGDVIKLNK